MAEGGPHWHPDEVARLTYRQILLFCEDRTELLQRLKNKRKHGGNRNVRSVNADHGIPASLKGKVKTLPGNKSLAQFTADEQRAEEKESRHAKRGRRKRRKNRG